MPSKTTAEIYSLSALSAIPLRALVGFAARCARRVQPLWGDLDSSDRTQLERAIEIAEKVADGRYTCLDARRAEGVGVEKWTPRRPDFGVTRTARGAAIYALACACCENSKEAATPALLAVREAHFAAGGSSRDLGEAEELFQGALEVPLGSALRSVARGIKRDFDCAGTAEQLGDPPVSPDFFGPLWPSGEPRGWSSA